MNENQVKLIAKGGDLFTQRDMIKDPATRNFFSEDPILVCRYDAGDCDTINWPNPNEENLRRALYDARETGVIPDVQLVTLPNGLEFSID